MIDGEREVRDVAREILDAAKQARRDVGVDKAEVEGEAKSVAPPESLIKVEKKGLKGVDDLQEAICAAAELIENSGFVVALTGAGLSVDSGIPDFRSRGGIWSWYEPSVYASLESFLDDPSKFWEMVQDLIPMLEAARPNPAHFVLTELEKMGRIQVFLSQNIDELLERAGCQRVIKIHGDMHTTTCLQCGRNFRTIDVVETIKGVGAPSCVECHGMLKPDVVLFNEPLRARDFKVTKEAAMRCDVMLVIGSSLGVFPVAELPKLARKKGAKIVMFDLQPSPNDELADIIVRGRAADTVPRLLEECKLQMGKARGSLDGRG